MDTALTMLALLLMVVAVRAGLFVWRLIFPPRPPVPLLQPSLVEGQIDRVISNGMDRVMALRQFGADRFLTFMPMPDGSCWSVTVTRHDDEPAAKDYYAPDSESVDDRTWHERTGRAI